MSQFSYFYAKIEIREYAIFTGSFLENYLLPPHFSIHFNELQDYLENRLQQEVKKHNGHDFSPGRVITKAYPGGGGQIYPSKIRI